LQSLLARERDAPSTVPWQPSADVYRTRSGWLIKLELAGVRAEDIRVQVAGNCVEVAGIRRDLFTEKVYVHHSMEIAYSQFMRTFTLPCDLASARIDTEYRDGMLLIHIELEGGESS
jgi:HSP20 family protein